MRWDKRYGYGPRVEIRSARNPIAHHDRNVSAADAARLIVYASYLLSILEARAS
jgi:hypothetical protein